MKNNVNLEPTQGTFFVKVDSDIPLSVAKKMLEHAQRMSKPEVPVISVSGESTTGCAKRTEIVFKNTP